MILFDSVTRQFHRKDGSVITAVDGLTLHIPKGMTIGVIGASGAGKTTFLKLICGLLVPDNGRVKVKNLVPSKARRALSESVSVLLADTSDLHPEKTVRDNLDLVRASYGNKRHGKAAASGEGRDRYEYLMEELNLIPYRDEVVSSLSLGFRRRAELAAAFLKPAELILLDEPCIGLDEQAKEGFEKIVRTCQKEGKTILLSSHSMGEIDALSQRILLLDEGKTVFYGDRESLYRSMAKIHRVAVTFADKIPDMQDLPFGSYDLDDWSMRIRYNAGHVTAAELLRTMLETSVIREVSMEKPSLEDIIAETAKQRVKSISDAACAAEQNQKGRINEPHDRSRTGKQDLQSEQTEKGADIKSHPSRL